MTVLEKIKRCVELVWDFEEIYDWSDIEAFCGAELGTYPQHDEILDYFKQIEELEKEKDKAWWEGFDTCKAKAGEANVKLNDELEKLKKQLEELPDKWCRNKDDYCPHLAKLEKENAELKADNVEWEKASDKWKSVYEITNNQLTKAKELLKKWVELYKPKLEGYPIPPIQEQTEQFLKDSEVEK